MKEECTTQNQSLEAYLDGELSQAHREGVEAHLTSCDCCQKELADIEKLALAIKSLPAMTMEKDLSQDLDFLDRSKAKVVPFNQTYAWGALAAGLLIAVLSFASIRFDSSHVPTIANSTVIDSTDKSEPKEIEVASLVVPKPKQNPDIAVLPKPVSVEKSVAPAPAPVRISAPAPVAIVTAPNELLSTQAVVAYDNDDSNLLDIGISTNEDGLYAIEL
ncbi:MAG: zf-HC2 domain-containing protein [Candidatus Obscuribacterales bacterium]|nr:zf-HC2 domain-containing protein [Candidatus Obscuribacterales bacterium]